MFILRSADKSKFLALDNCARSKMALMRDLSGYEAFPTLHPQSCLCLVHTHRWGHHNADSAHTTPRKPLAQVPRQRLCSGRRNSE